MSFQGSHVPHLMKSRSGSVSEGKQEQDDGMKTHGSESSSTLELENRNSQRSEEIIRETFDRKWAHHVLHSKRIVIPSRAVGVVRYDRSNLVCGFVFWGPARRISQSLRA